MRVSMIIVVAALGSSLGSRIPTLQAAKASARVLGDTVNCIDARSISERRVVSPTSLTFEVAGVTYRNDLPEACPRLGRDPDSKVIQLEVYGAQVCTGDSFRAYDPVEGKGVGAEAFARCRLEAFTPISAR